MTLFLQSEIEKASKLGFAEGSKGLPSPDAMSPDLNESKFYAKAISQLNKIAESLTPKITTLSKKVADVNSKLDTTRAIVDALHNRTSLEAQIDSRLKQSQSEMVEAKKNQLLRESELNAFKLSNNLHHPAVFPADMAQHMSWVAIALAIETLINAAFFAGANGLIVGAIIAFTVAGVNLGTAFIGGWFFRGKNSVNFAVKTQAWLIFLVSWFLIATLNLLTAAYRSASAELLSKKLGEDPIAAIFSNQFEAFQQALTNVAGILDGRFPFSDLNGLILMFVGILAAVIGMWKGYGADDPYPKYGAITRSSNAASKIYNDLETSLKADAQKAADKPLMEIADSRQSINSIKQQIGASKKEASDLRNDWQQKFKQITHEFSSIVDVYRKSVKSVKPNPIPAYFNEAVELPENESIHQNLTDLDFQISTVQENVESFSSEALPFLADAEQALNIERSTLLGNIIVAHIDKLTATARASI
jgi:hypothetical protein